MSSDRARETGPALESMYQLITWLVPTLEKFPRSQKFLLGDSGPLGPPRALAAQRTLRHASRPVLWAGVFVVCQLRREVGRAQLRGAGVFQQLDHPALGLADFDPRGLAAALSNAAV